MLQQGTAGRVILQQAAHTTAQALLLEHAQHGLLAASAPAMHTQANYLPHSAQAAHLPGSVPALLLPACCTLCSALPCPALS